MSLGPGVIGGMFASLVLAWLTTRSVPRARFRNGRFIVEYRLPAKIVAWFSLAGGLFIVYVASRASVDQRILAAFVGGALFLAALFLFSEFQFVRIEFDEKRIYTFSPWRKRGGIPWSAVCGDSFSKVNQWHVLKTRGYRSIRLSRLMSGLGTMREQWQKKCLQMEASSQAPPTHKSL
jgi:hypothetical protein